MSLQYWCLVQFFHGSRFLLSLICSKFAELLFHHYCPFRGHWWETWDDGHRVICCWCAGWEHQGRNMLLCWGSNQMQPEVTGWCVGAFGRARPNWAHRQSLMYVGQTSSAMVSVYASGKCKVSGVRSRWRVLHPRGKVIFTFSWYFMLLPSIIWICCL